MVESSDDEIPPFYSTLEEEKDEILAEQQQLVNELAAAKEELSALHERSDKSAELNRLRAELAESRQESRLESVVAQKKMAEEWARIKEESVATQQSLADELARSREENAALQAAQRDLSDELARSAAEKTILQELSEVRQRSQNDAITEIEAHLAQSQQESVILRERVRLQESELLEHNSQAKVELLVQKKLAEDLAMNKKDNLTLQQQLEDAMQQIRKISDERVQAFAQVQACEEQLFLLRKQATELHELLPRQEVIQEKDVVGESADPLLQGATAIENSNRETTSAELKAKLNKAPTDESLMPQEAHRQLMSLPLHYDDDHIIRGACTKCKHCTAWQRSGNSDIKWRHDLLEGVRRKDNSICDCCQCPAAAHLDHTPWWRKAKAKMKQFREQPHTLRLIPNTFPVPACALKWSPTDVALYVLSQACFDPREHGRMEFVADEDKRGAPLISVCIPTSTCRHPFHKLMYENFRGQRYENKELVVIDTGKYPSSLLAEKARQESNVIYRFFQLEDAKQDRENPFSEVHYVPPKDTWSLGFKRNVAAHLARGHCIAHFDDDDLYSPIYLRYMIEELFSSMGLHPKRDEARFLEVSRTTMPAIVTLSEWHTFDFRDKLFHYMNPRHDPGTRRKWKEDMTWGYGFSYLYTRAAWETHGFQDREDGEDDVFMAQLRKTAERRGATAKLVQLPGGNQGLVAHNFTGRNTGVMEYDGDRRLGTRTARPAGFDDLMPLLDEIFGS